MNKFRDPRIVRSLQYFEAVARLGSLQQASVELGITPSAVSHQLRDLSRAVGEDIVIRSGRGIALTAAGEKLADRLSHAFNLLDESLESVIGNGQPGLRLAVCSSFGPYWLAPRMPQLLASNLGFDPELRLYSEDPEQSVSVADCIITARPVKPGFASFDLFDETLVAVVGGESEFDHEKTPLITTDIEPVSYGGDWLDFRRIAPDALSEFDRDRLVGCTHYLLAASLARAGIGAALIPDFVAEADIEQGRLRAFSGARLASGRTYKACVKEARQGEPGIRRLIGWLRSCG